ncbi:hypothetical protein AAVH_15000 [Aphelenchoides avenae]|nr:hypothetical protein AAVH_15000 [Aphelenchus avenae]
MSHLIELLRYRRNVLAADGDGSSTKDAWQNFPVRMDFPKPSFADRTAQTSVVPASSVPGSGSTPSIASTSAANEPVASNRPPAKTDEPVIVEYEEAYAAAEKGIVAVFFHMGFDAVQADALETMADVFLRKVDKMCRDLHVVHRRKLAGRPCAFKNPVHQVLDLHNLDAMDVHKAYHIRVLKRHENLFNECLRMYTKREEKSVKEESKEEQQSATAQSKGRTLRKREPVAPAVRDSQEGTRRTSVSTRAPEDLTDRRVTRRQAAQRDEESSSDVTTLSMEGPEEATTRSPGGNDAQLKRKRR